MGQGGREAGGGWERIREVIVSFVLDL